MNIKQLKLKKLEFLSEIYALTVKQRDALRENDLGKLENLIEVKEELMGKIDEIDLLLKEFREANDKDEKIQATLKNIVEIDQENQGLARQLFFTFQKKIGQINNTRKINKAYQPNFPDSMLVNKVR